MSLRRLMKCKMTIQSSEEAVNDDDFAVDREGSWVNLSDFRNIKCNLQQKSRREDTTKYSKEEFETTHRLYHQSIALYSRENPSALRVIIAKNPREKITDVTNKDSFDVYEIKGHTEQVPSERNRKRLFVLHIEKNDRWIK